MSVNDPTAEDLFKAGKIDDVSDGLWAEFNKARDAEALAINEFEKTLWLTNSGAATITIGYITSAADPSLLQFVGSSIFVFGIVLLFVMKLFGEINATRDRKRRLKASENFFHKGTSMSSFDLVRDNVFKRLSLCYRTLKISAAVCFISGCVVTLVGLYPLVSI